MNMNKRFSMTILIPMLISSSGCDDPDHGFVYPLSVGNSWEYTREWSSFSYADSLNPVYEDTSTFTSQISVTVTGTAVLRDTFETYALTAAEIQGSQTYTGIGYFGQGSDGLYLYGHEGFGSNVLPKRASGGPASGKVLFKGMSFDSVRELLDWVQQSQPVGYLTTTDSLYQEIPPLKTIPYPLTTGTTWTYRPPRDPLWIVKQVMGKETVAVPAGSYACHRITWRYDVNGDGVIDEGIEINDYIGPVGLVLRHVVVKGSIRKDETGGVIGYIDTIGEYKLETVSIEG